MTTKAVINEGNLSFHFTTRLRKGGALLSEMRQYVLAASRDPQVAGSAKAARSVVTKSTAARLTDIFMYVFKPRFVEGSPPDAWRIPAIVESLSPDLGLVRSLYYWITARAEPLLYDFVTTELFDLLGSSDRDVRLEEVLVWLERQLRDAGKRWTSDVRRKLVRGLLAALRDFGLLELADDLRQFSAHLKAAAESGWVPHTDDGILLDAAPLHELLRSWPETRKAYQELSEGRYDWAGQAMAYCPNGCARSATLTAHWPSFMASPCQRIRRLPLIAADAARTGPRSSCEDS